MAVDLKPIAREPGASRALYERDFYSWTREQASLIRAGRLKDVDVSNLAEEIETLGRAQLNELRSRYAILCLHLLKAMFQSQKDGRSWRLTIATQRIEIARLLKDNPGLKPKRMLLFAEGYRDGRKLAIVETELPTRTFPTTPPFSVDDAENDKWRPASSK